MRIAICDDNVAFLNKFEKIVKEYFSLYFDDYTIDEYTNGIVLLNHHQNTPFDIIFLDIDMPKVTGFEVANELKKVNKNCNFVFVTNHSEYVYECFDFQPFNYIEKDDIGFASKKMKRIVVQLSQAIKQKETVVLDDPITGRAVFEISDITYIESCGHFVNYHINNHNAVFRSRAKLKDLEEKYKAADFIRIQKKYLVNLRYVLDIDLSNNRVIMKQGEKLSLSRSIKKDVDKRFNEYLRMMT